MTVSIDRSTKNQKRHIRRTKRRTIKRESKLTNNKFYSNNSIVSNSKTSIREKLSRYDAWNYFAEILRSEYNFDVTISFQGKHSTNQTSIKKVIVVKTPYNGFTIQIENESNNTVKIYYCYNNEAIIYRHYLCFYSKSSRELNDGRDNEQIETYVTNDFIECTKKYSNDYDEIFNDIFGPNDFIDRYIANKIINRIHFNMSMKGFLNFMTLCGFEMIQEICSDKEIKKLCSKRRGNVDDYCDHLSMYNDVLKIHERLNEYSEKMEIYEYDEKLHGICCAYKNCRDILCDIAIGANVLIKSIRLLIMNYIV
jgi:hypothetical protein